MPDMHALAKQVASGDWLSYMVAPPHDFYEDILLHGLVLTRLRLSIGELWPLIDRWVPLIDNWACCDSVGLHLRFAKSDKAVLWDYLLPYVQSSEEFKARFGVVVLLDGFINAEYIERTLSLLGTVKECGYYADMAVAWALSDCCIKFAEQTQSYLRRNTLRKIVHNTAITKAIQSRRVSLEVKSNLRSLIRS